ncbi:TCP-1/cpn60 chaperonin family protein [Actinidia rufa]|uniref:TCP-1/cpn60 chaperonin family protein n=2 Tax=asterids TaxID=71274 RepID=A0A7J0EAC5_9ERIC|nr:TCP-1/cpn60 chaperonin family protein [Actinidia rufa]
MSLRVLNPNAEVLNKSAALHMNINAAKGLQDVLKTNLGPKGTIKMLVGGAGDIKLTKDGNTLLKEMQIQNPTAIMIARTAVAQDDISGDGTTSTVLFIGELMKQSERCIDEGMHPRVLVDGFEIAKKATLQFLEKFKTPVVMGDEPDKEILKMLYEVLADQLTGIVVNAVLCIRKPEEAVDLFMVEIMHMRHKFDVDTRLAFDSVSWEHIFDMLAPLGLPDRFWKWIELWSLFSRILHSHIIAGQFSFHPKCHDLGITHICFADDLFILCSPDYASFHIVHNAPLEFHKFSGLQPNGGKSKVYFGGIPEQVKAALCGLLGFQCGTLLVRYLGVPLISTNLTIGDYSPLIDKITTKSGIGIRRVVDWSNAAMLKHIWVIVSNQNSLWLQWTHVFVIKSNCFWTMKAPCDCSWTWRKLFQLRPIARPFVRSITGNGTSTFFCCPSSIAHLSLISVTPSAWQHHITWLTGKFSRKDFYNIVRKLAWAAMVEGLVLDHGSRHPDMKRRAENCYILTCFFYSNAEQREAMVAAERRSVDERVKKIIALKNKGGDIIALRRAKRRNMERLVLACGGEALNSVDHLTPDCLGWAGLVYEHVLGEEKYTFVENVKNPHSCTILIKGPNDHTIAQIKDAAVRDGLRAVKNTIEDESVVLGAGAFEVAARQYLVNEVKKTVQGRAQLGVEAFADALLVIPKTLAENSGLDTQDVIISLTGEHDRGNIVGLNQHTGEPIDPQMEGIFDNYSVKRQIINSGYVKNYFR